MGLMVASSDQESLEAKNSSLFKFISENCYAKTLTVKVQGYEIAVIWCILHVCELCIILYVT